MAFITFQPSDYFNTKLYTGNGSTNAQTGIGFLPSWTWIKNRGDTHAHVLVDVVRGVTKELRSSATTAEVTTTNSFTSFDSDGFTLGADSGDNYNKNSNNYVSWNWKAGGSPSSNSNGSITSSVSASPTSGFSIVSWTGNASASTVGHGLSQPVEMIIIRNRPDTEHWGVGHKNADESLPWKYRAGRLNTTDARAETGTYFADTAPTNTVFKVEGNSEVNGSGDAMIAYCFHSVKGFSKVGKYIGNASADGPFCYTGFKPAFVLYKKVSSSGDNWVIQDDKREGFNPNNRRLYPNDTSAENTSSFRIDMLSNGFKLNNSDADSNANGETFIYLAFAAEPLVASNGTPATAK